MSHGTIGLRSNKQTAAIVKIGCQTDFAAIDELCVSLADGLAKTLMETGTVEESGKSIEATAGILKEELSVETALLEVEDGNILDTYIHNQNGRGVAAVAIEGRNISAEVLHQIALHIVFAKPVVVDKSQFSDKDLFVIKAEIRNEMAEMDLSGKPDGVRDKIAAGKLAAWQKERALMEQFLFEDKTQPVKDVVGDGTIVKFRTLSV